MKTEVFHQPIEEIGRIRELAQRLNLVKQVEKLEKPFPVIPMTPIEFFVYNTLCPKHVDLEDYDAELMPADVLEEVLRAKTEGNFSKFEVWSIDELKIDDPVVVGYTVEQYDFQRKPCLIARWGNELLPFPVLLADAKRAAADVFRRYKNELESRIRDLEHFLHTDSRSYSGSKETSERLQRFAAYHVDQLFPRI